MIDEREKLNQEAERLVKAMMDRDETTRDVVKAMQSQGRSWAKIATCFRLKVLAAALVLIVIGSAAHAANPPCPPGVNPNALCNQPAATNLQSSDLVQVYEYAQTPGTRAATVQQLLAGYPSAIINGAAPPYNIVGDGVTSNDVGMAAALAACAAQGTTLLLPPGKILLSGAGSTTSQLHNCAVVGSGFLAGTNGSATSYGTTIELTSTTVPPFYIAQNWSVSGVNFYWPNQATGTTAYPPLFSDNGHNAGFFHLDHVGVVNAYDFLTQTTGTSWGNFFISNSDMYAVHKMYTFANLGDSVHLTNNHYTPGIWLNVCSSCNSAINAADQVNKLIDVIAGGTVTMFESNAAVFAWRYGIYVESGGLIGGSELDYNFDDVGTLIDTSSGGIYAFQNVLHGTGNCAIANFGGSATGNHPCFNLGTVGALVLSGFHGSSRGDFVKTTGASVYINGVQVDQIGTAADGTDYGIVNIPSGSPEVVVQNGHLQGDPSDAHVWGLLTASNVLSRLAVQNNGFLYFQSPISVHTSNATNIITGNWAGGTNGTSAVVLTGTDPIAYANNEWDKPPQATVTSCGSGASVAGGVNGTISVGSTDPTTACTLTLPFSPLGSSGGNCTFWTNGGTLVTGGPSGAPPVWSLTFNPNFHGGTVFYNCPGQQ